MKRSMMCRRCSWYDSLPVGALPLNPRERRARGAAAAAAAAVVVGLQSMRGLKRDR
jgi:hypothetical protein